MAYTWNVPGGSMTTLSNRFVRAVDHAHSAKVRKVSREASAPLFFRMPRIVSVIHGLAAPAIDRRENL